MVPFRIGSQSFQGAHTTNWPKLMAGTVLSQLPVLVVFFVAQRCFVRSVASVGIR